MVGRGSAVGLLGGCSSDASRVEIARAPDTGLAISNHLSAATRDAIRKGCLPPDPPAPSAEAATLVDSCILNSLKAETASLMKGILSLKSELENSFQILYL